MGFILRKMKYYNAMVVFEEIPNEITLAINLSNCPCHCKGCHSKFLWEDVGTELTLDELNRLIDKNDGITTVCFMGGDATPKIVDALAEYTHEIRNLKVGWYSGMDEFYKNINFIGTTTLSWVIMMKKLDHLIAQQQIRNYLRYTTRNLKKV